MPKEALKYSVWEFFLLRLVSVSVPSHHREHRPYSDRLYMSILVLQVASYTFTFMFTVTALKTTITSSREPPFYAGTGLNLTCNVDLPDTVDPQIITGTTWTNNFRKFSMKYMRAIGRTLIFHPLRMTYRLNTYRCSVVLRGQHFAMSHDESQSLNVEITGNHGMHLCSLLCIHWI